MNFSGIAGVSMLWPYGLMHGYSGALILSATQMKLIGVPKESKVAESLQGIVCKCETRTLMMHGCRCGAMKAELAQAHRGRV